jgi:uncharacterized membrane protein YvlD (DUF360 family)
MYQPIRSAARIFFRFALLWVVDAFSLLLTSWLLPGIDLAPVGTRSVFTIAIAAVFLLTLVNFLIRPLVLLVARPLGWIALFAVGFVVNAAALWLTAALMPGFTVDLFGAVVGGLVFAFFNGIITGILDLDEDGSWYQNRIEKRAAEQPFAPAPADERGLMMVEIDGLSYWHLKQALDDGLLPTLAQMIKEEGYVLSHVDCGLPSMTSSCQAGIMFGDNHDIPAYRWYDKEKKKLYVSASDATELNGRYAHGQGLMRHGSSIMNMMAGDAEKSLFTMANMWTGDEQEKERRAQDVALLMLNPYFLARVILLFLGETGRELWEALMQKVKNVQPRLNRLEHWYPFVRAAMCAPMREICTNVAVLDMMRGAPSIYMLYLGYDEVAHHSGPWTSDAFGDLRRLDKTFARLRRAIHEKAARPYSLIILSDHGQSFGATFKQRYGLSIKEFIEQQLPHGTTVAQAIGGDTGAMGLQGMAGELANVHTQGAGNRLTRRVAQGSAKLAHKAAALDSLPAGARSARPLGPDAPSPGVQPSRTGVPATSLAGEGAVEAHPIPADQTAGQAFGSAEVTAYGSGNAAQVYFSLFDRKIKLSELQTAYPGVVDALVQHEGIGMVLGYEDDMTAVVLGKGGRRNLHTGEVVGVDPVAPYAPAAGHGAASLDTRIWQLRRVMEFPSAGDLWLHSTVYPDGTVAALEELVGSHGGVGGEQTDAFIFHPPDVEVPPTRCSTDVFHILNAYRATPPPQQPVPTIRGTEERSWAPRTLVRGIGRVRFWLPLALRCLILDPRAYAHVAKDPYMTGPALVILLLSTLLSAAVEPGDIAPWLLLGYLAVWLITTVVIFAAGRFLSRAAPGYSTGTFTGTFRALAFAEVVSVISLFALYQPLEGVVRAFSVVLNLLAIWVAAATAHRLRGWRAAVFPLIALLVYVMGILLIFGLLGGAEFTVQALLADFGLQPQ